MHFSDLTMGHLRRCKVVGSVILATLSMVYLWNHSRILHRNAQREDNMPEYIRQGILDTYGDLNSDKSEQRKCMAELEKFIHGIISHRQYLLSNGASNSTSAKSTSGGQVAVLAPDAKDFFHVAKLHPQLKNFIFGKPKEATSYRILNNTFDWICDDRLYGHLTTNEKHHFPSWYPNACERDISKSFVPRYKLDDLFWRGKRNQDISQDMIRSDDGYPIPTFMNIVEDGFVSPLGYVFSKNMKLAHMQCATDKSPNIPKFPPDVPYYDEVFVISQYWGEAVYHTIAEDLTRAGPYISFLKQHPSIKIHTVNFKLIGNFLAILGIDRSRLVDKNVRAKIIYVPQGTPCGNPRVLGMQMLARALRVQMIKKHPPTNSPKRNILLIRRSGTRRFKHHNAILKSIQDMSRPFGYKVRVFKDNPIPPFAEVAEMFFRADIVVAPHGAGLVNTILCEPGTVVIEGLCHLPHTNMCHKHTAVIAGLQYYGTASYRGCEEINDLRTSDIEKSLRFYLDQLNRTVKSDAMTNS